MKRALALVLVPFALACSSDLTPNLSVLVEWQAAGTTDRVKVAELAADHRFAPVGEKATVDKTSGEQQTLSLAHGASTVSLTVSGNPNGEEGKGQFRLSITNAATQKTTTFDCTSEEDRRFSRDLNVSFPDGKYFLTVALSDMKCTETGGL